MRQRQRQRERETMGRSESATFTCLHPSSAALCARSCVYCAVWQASEHERKRGTHTLCTLYAFHSSHSHTRTNTHTHTNKTHFLHNLSPALRATLDISPSPLPHLSFSPSTCHLPPAPPPLGSFSYRFSYSVISCYSIILMVGLGARVGKVRNNLFTPL